MVGNTKEKLARYDLDHLNSDCQDGMKGGDLGGSEGIFKMGGIKERNCHSDVVLAIACWSRGQMKELQY